MLFMFPGKIFTKDLEAELAPFFALARTELEYVTGFQISLLGWRGESRCQIRDEDGLISVISFDAVGDTDVTQPVRDRRDGTRILDRPRDMEWHPLASVFNHDD